MKKKPKAKPKKTRKPNQRSILGEALENTVGDPVAQVVYVSTTVNAVHVRRLSDGKIYKMSRAQYDSLRHGVERAGGTSAKPPKKSTSGKESLIEEWVPCRICGESHMRVIRDGVPDPMPRCPRAGADGEAGLVPWMMPAGPPGATAPRPSKSLRTVLETFDADGLAEFMGRGPFSRHDPSDPNTKVNYVHLGATPPAPLGKSLEEHQAAKAQEMRKSEETISDGVARSQDAEDICRNILKPVRRSGLR